MRGLAALGGGTREREPGNDAKHAQLKQRSPPFTAQDDCRVSAPHCVLSQGNEPIAAKLEVSHDKVAREDDKANCRADEEDNKLDGSNHAPANAVEAAEEEEQAGLDRVPTYAPKGGRHKRACNHEEGPRGETCARGSIDHAGPCACSARGHGELAEASHEWSPIATQCNYTLLHRRERLARGRNDWANEDLEESAHHPNEVLGVDKELHDTAQHKAHSAKEARDDLAYESAHRQQVAHNSGDGVATFGACPHDTHHTVVADGEN